MGAGKERKMNDGLATANKVRDGCKGMKQKHLQRESSIKIFNHKTSLPNIVLSNYVFRVSRKHTSCVSEVVMRSRERAWALW